MQKEKKQNAKNKTSSQALADYVVQTLSDKKLSTYDVERQSQGKINQSYVSKIKSGKVLNPSTPKQKALAAGLGVPEDEIYSLVNGTKTKSDTSQTVAAYVSELPAKIQEDVLVIVQALHAKHSSK